MDTKQRPSRVTGRALERPGRHLPLGCDDLGKKGLRGDSGRCLAKPIVSMGWLAPGAAILVAALVVLAATLPDGRSTPGGLMADQPPTGAGPGVGNPVPVAQDQPDSNPADTTLTDDDPDPLTGLTAQERAAGFKALFDGRTFEGWKGNRDVFRIVDGALVGGRLDKELPNNEFLRSEESFEDFELRLEFKLVGERSNGGVQFRTAEIPDHHEVIGYQADMGDGWWGCLYDETRRNRVLAGPAENERNELIRRDDWNDYRILCRGNHIQLWINGRQTVDYREEDPEIPRSGIIALQIHSGPPAEASYRKIRIKPLPAEQ